MMAAGRIGLCCLVLGLGVAVTAGAADPTVGSNASPNPMPDAQAGSAEKSNDLGSHAAASPANGAHWTHIEPIVRRQGDPRWVITADALLLHRSAPEGPSLLADPVGGNDLLTSSDLTSNLAAGPRLVLTWKGFSSCDVEVNYFGVDGWDARADFENTNLPSVVGFLTVDSTFVLPVNSVSFRDYSRLYSLEVNLRRPLSERVTGLAGFRWVDFGDFYHVQGVGMASRTPFTETANLRNHIYGFQLGLDARLWETEGGLSIQGVAKTGIFGTSVEQDSRLYDPSGSGVFSVSASDTHASFVAELGLVASYRITPHVELRGGYQAFWLEGVALAPRSVENTDLTAGTASIDITDGAFFHGASAGLEFSW